jgi:hypothetical protein
MTYKTGTWGEQAKKRAKTRNEYFRLYKKRRNPLMIKARYLVEQALKKGLLIKKSCEVCFNVKSQAHHPDYLKPLEVIWLCPKHHREADKEMR